jgi:hypothetical protein
MLKIRRPVSIFTTYFLNDHPVFMKKVYRRRLALSNETKAWASLDKGLRRPPGLSPK